MSMRRVVLESPYAGDVEENVKYARACVRDCLLRDEAPIASHLLYTQPGILDDTVPEERQMGIEAGLVWGSSAEATVVYLDRGVSHGMKYGIERAQKEGRQMEYRALYKVVCISCGADASHEAAIKVREMQADWYPCPKCVGLYE
jgi:hypothetical protein